MRIREAKRDACRSISIRDADLLLGFVLHKDRPWLLAHVDDEFADEAVSRYMEVVARRAAGEPIQYVTEQAEFYGLPLHVGPGVLIPRPETEHLIDAVLDWVADKEAGLQIADMGTGSGALALALAKHLPDANIWATDISQDALAIARENARRLGLEHRVRFVHADLLGTEFMHLDAVISNPPYVPDGDAAGMQNEVVNYEPHNALFAGPDGLSVYRRLIPQAWKALRSGGLLAMEIGYGQSHALQNLLSDWMHVRFLPDYAGIDRIVLAEHP